MPVSVAALCSGMLTLVATAPNLVVNAEMQRAQEEGHNITPFGLFSITPVGVIILLWMRHNYSSAWQTPAWHRKHR